MFHVNARIRSDTRILDTAAQYTHSATISKQNLNGNTVHTTGNTLLT